MMINKLDDNQDDVSGESPEELFVEAEVGVAGVNDFGLTDSVNLEEIALQEEIEMDKMERRELLVNPSDLQDVGDPEAGDVGLPGGLAAGGQMGEGGYGHVGDDLWGLELMEGEKL